MAEGRTKVYYVSDIIPAFDNTGAGVPAQFLMSIPNNLVAEAALGWSPTPANGGPTDIRIPKRIRPRHAIGVNATGKRVKVIIAKTSADLWTRVASTWTYIDNFGATQTATVTGLVGEAATV